MDKKLKERIRRLQAMAQDASSEHEAMIAARRLHALLAKHGMDVVELEDLDDTKVGEAEYVVPISVVSGYWSRLIAQKIAKLYFCECFSMDLGNNRTHRITIVGQKRYRDTARAISLAVSRAVNAEARRTAATRCPVETDLWAYISSFRDAAAARISRRCDQMIRDARAGELQDEDGANLPVLASMYDSLLSDADAWMRANYRISSRSMKGRNASREGTAAGDQFGQGVALGHELGDAAPKALPSR